MNSNTMTVQILGLRKKILIAKKSPFWKLGIKGLTILFVKPMFFLEFFSQNVLILKFPNKNLLEFSNTVK